MGVMSVTRSYPWDPVDPLGEALHFLRMSGLFYCRSELTAPWALEMPAFEDCLSFHVVTAGTCLLQVQAATPSMLRPGDLALVPHGRGHLLLSEPDVPSAGRVDLLPQQQVSDHYSILRYGPGGPASSIVCGIVRFDHPAAHQFLGVLPPVIHVQAAEASEWMLRTLGLLAAEAAQLRPGGEAVITRLADILVIQAIRSWLERDPAAHRGWLGALQDEQVGRAMTLIHRRPAEAWTVASLAREVGMSRSAFSARFTELVGEPVMRYVTNWRMHLALTWLREDKLSVGQLASRLGYESEAAFARAFKRVIGAAPGSARLTTSLTAPDRLAPPVSAAR